MTIRARPRWEDRRVISRFRWVLIAGTFTLAGCGEMFDPGPLEYVDSPRLQSELKDKPAMQASVRKALGNLFGPEPREIHVPVGSGLPMAAARLANFRHYDDGNRPQAFRVDLGTQPAEQVPIRGGFAVYREHCLHCHGVS